MTILFLLGIFIGIDIGVLATMLYQKAGMVERREKPAKMAEFLRNLQKKRAQFIDPVSAQEKFDKAEAITDLTNE